MRRHQVPWLLAAIIAVAAMLAALPASAQTGYYSAPLGCAPGAYSSGRCGYSGAYGNLPAYERWENGAPATGSGSSENPAESGNTPFYFRGIGSVHDFGR